MTEEIKTKPLNKELLRYFVLIVLSIAVLTIAMIVSVFNPQILIIGAVIGTMEEIAGQTNLLALNASIEAARAGSMEAGFAVVAGEVANLADQSQQASHSIADLIWTTIDTVNEGDKKVRETAEHLEEIINITKDIIHNVEEVFASTRNETDAIEKIRGGVNDISEMVLTSSAASQENAAASEELATQAQLLKELIENFKVDE